MSFTGYPSIDKPWLNLLKKYNYSLAYPKCSVYDAIYNQNKNFPNDLAFIYYGKKITFEELFRKIEITAKSFISLGVCNNDNVIVISPLIPEVMYVFLALNRIGANVFFVNPINPAEIENRIKIADCKIAFAMTELFESFKNLIEESDLEKVILCSAKNSFGFNKAASKLRNKKIELLYWKNFIKKGKTISSVPDLPYEIQKNAAVVGSSGSTGLSKCIQLTDDSIIATFINELGIGIEWKRKDRSFCQVPVWVSTGLSITILTPLYYGMTLIMEPLYNHKKLYKQIRKYKPTFAISTPSMIQYFMTNHYFDKSYACFKQLIIGGEYITEATEKKMNKWLHDNNNRFDVLKGYGMCECGGTVTTCTADNNVIGSAGLPLPDIVVSAFDLDSGCELKYGEKGEIRMTTPSRMKHYYKDKNSTDNYLKSDDEGRIWCHSGDMGYVDENGFVFILGRLKESYKNEEGKTIYLFLIEREILSLDCVKECRVITNIIDGKINHVAHVVTESDYKTVINIIMENCLKKLGNEYVPHYFKMYNDNLPVSPTIKVDIKVLKESGFDFRV